MKEYFESFGHNVIDVWYCNKNQKFYCYTGIAYLEATKKEVETWQKDA